MKVELITYYPNGDLLVVNAARVSFNKWKDELDDKDRRLISYLARHGHISPFFHPHLTFRIKTPIFVARQLMRHQVGLAVNEISRRYVTESVEMFMPAYWRKKADHVKQGSSLDGVDNQGEVSAAVVDLNAYALHIYNKLLDWGVCPEQARMVLPQSMYTQWIWTGSLYAFARVVRLRLDQHAQAETREVARQIDSVIRNLPGYECSWQALMEELPWRA